jgi:uroporphyrinogen decarboxylase
MTIPKKIEELAKRIIDGLAGSKFTPLERLNKLYRFEEADRLTGSFAFWNPAAVGIHDVSQEEFYRHPEKMYYCHLLALDTFKHDFPLLLADNYNTEPEALGAEIVFTGEDTPVLVKPAIKSKEELYGLQVPDPLKDGRLPYRIEICRIHKDVLGKYYPTITPINAPFSMAVGMRGYEALILDMAEDPDFVHNLLEFCTEVIIVFGKAIKSACGSYPGLSDAWSSIPHLSPDKFLEFSFPYAARCIQVFERSGWTFGGGHQFGSDWKRSLRTLMACGSRSLTLFEENITGIRGGKTVDLREVRKICRSRRVFLYTAIHPDTMLNGPPEIIKDLMIDWIKQVSSGGGHGFYTSALTGTPPEHIKVFVDTLKKSTFPIL